jgi:hypothetical protein
VLATGKDTETHMRKTILGLIIFSIIDICYTAVGTFYGGGGAELNPLFSWITDPVAFVLFVAIVKAIVIGGIAIGILKLYEHEQDHPFKCAKYLGIGINVLYGCMLFGILGLNVWFQICR